MVVDSRRVSLAGRVASAARRTWASLFGTGNTDGAWEPSASAVVLGFAIVFNLWALAPEVSISAPDPSDRLLHVLLVERTLDALARGDDPTDFWVPDIGAGFPVPHHYQHLPHLVAASLVKVSGGAMTSAGGVGWLTYLLVSLYPLALHLGMRRFGFAPLEAGLAALLGSLVSSERLYGHEFGAYAWASHGFYTQAFAMTVLPLALAQAATTLRDGRCYARATVLLAFVGLCHLLVGYMAALGVGAMALLGPGTRLVRCGRLGLLGVAAAVATSYMLVPALADAAYANRSVWEPAEKLDSHGHLAVLGGLLTGRMFDFGRLPVLTTLALLGAATCAVRWGDERCRLVLGLFLIWLALYFGRPTWGPLLDLLPMGRSIHFERFVGGVHVAGAMLAGIGAARLVRWMAARRSRWVRGMLLPALPLLVLPLHRERLAFMARNAGWKAETGAAWLAVGGDVERALAAVRGGGPGRVYAGFVNNWGRRYRVGEAPVYALLHAARLDSLSYLYHSLSMSGDVQALFQEDQLDWYRLFNVRHAVVPAGKPVPPFYRAAGVFGHHAVYQVPTTGYFALVDSPVTLFGDVPDWHGATRSWLVGGGAGAGQHPTIMFGPSPMEATARRPLRDVAATGWSWPDPVEGERGVVDSEAVDDGEYVASVQLRRPCFLMLRASYHPGWTCAVDGVSASAVMLAPAFVGVKLGPGSHTVRFAYRAPWYRKLLFALGAFALVGIAAFERWRSRVTGRPAEETR